MAEHSFTLSGAVLPGGDDPLGIWYVSENHAVSFAAEASVPAEPTWRIELPESPVEAQAVLAGRTHAMELAQQDLAQAHQELDRLNPMAPSFSAAEEFLAQKNALLATVGGFQEPVSYTISSLPKKTQDQESYRQWHAFVDQVRQMITHYARIETVLAGSNVGLTTVGWTGDFATTWAPAATTTTMQRHRQSVHLVLDSRVAMMRIISVVATGAVGLAAKAAIPGGQVLLLPAVYKFIRDVLKELRQSWPQIQKPDF